MTDSSDACVPTAVTDFIFDLYDSVTLSHIAEEQAKLYGTTRTELQQKYFQSTPWPSAQSIASECNGDPLFLAVYRELSHRHWHAVSRPALGDRIEGWNVYRELFEEILDGGQPNFYLLPEWIFEILHEFVYQFQGFCQIRTAVYGSARKNGLLLPDGTLGNVPDKHSNLAENLSILQNNPEAWEVEAVFGYLHRLIRLGLPPSDAQGKTTLDHVQPVYVYFALFGSIVLSRLECLLGDYTACLQALQPLHAYQDAVIPKDEGQTVADCLQSVFAARMSLAYHAGVSFLMLRRYRDAVSVLADCAAVMQRGFKTGALRNKLLPGADQFNKQYERISALIAILVQICPSLPQTVEDSIVRAVKEKHGSKMEAAASYEEWFMSPKFVSPDSGVTGYHGQQVELFLQEMEAQPAGKKLRSYLKLYTSLPVEKLAKFHDTSVPDFLPLLLSYKVRMRQKERGDGDSFAEGSWKTALDIHYYVEEDTVYVDEAEMQRRFENYFVAQIAQSNEIRQEAVAIDTNV
jgi:translation initiation factor 3 subunit L